MRETALRIKIINERLNGWSYFAGASLFPRDIYQPSGPTDPTKPDYWGYRGDSGMCKLSNGNIIRVRVGDGSAGNRQLFVQTITNPLIASQWTTWVLLYSGTHYSAAVVPETATTYSVFHAKSGGGLFKNNALVYQPASKTNVLGWVPLNSTSLVDKDTGWVKVLKVDAYDKNRTIDFYWSTSINTGSVTYDPSNFRWDFPYVSGLRLPLTVSSARYASFDRKYGVVRVQMNPLYFNPRDRSHGVSAWVSFQRNNLELSPPALLRGLGGGAGTNFYSNPYLTKLSDGYYYLFMSEIHQAGGALTEFTTDQKVVPVWMRSLDLLHWSEPIVGPGAAGTFGLAGVVESSGYLWWADNGQVWQRPMGKVETEISNFVPEVHYDMPRDNQVGGGTLTVANPAGINDNILNLSDREIRIEHGIRGASGSFKYKQFSRFWIERCDRQIAGRINRIKIDFKDLFARLENPLRDVYNFVGQTTWEDWASGSKNQPFNYFFEADTAPVVTKNFELNTRGSMVYTAWKGHNSVVEAKFSGIAKVLPGLFSRYSDTKNYLVLRRDSGTKLVLYSVVAGVMKKLDTFTVPNSKTPLLKLQLEWNTYRVWQNDIEYFGANSSIAAGFENSKPGYVGVYGAPSKERYTVDHFKMHDIENPLTLGDLARTALALGGQHEVSIGGATDRAYAITWGPQTDISTPAEGLRSILETEKLQMIWRSGLTIEIGKFNDPGILRTLQDQIIQTDRTEEANRRINLASVDGNEHSWIAIDLADQAARDRSINAYLDVPELLDQDAVKARAREEISRSALGASPGGTITMLFDIFRMDWLRWIDNQGNIETVRVEGITVDASQGTRPYQRMKLDTSLVTPAPSDIFIDELTEGPGKG